jgi:hypothetical protein
MEITNNKRITNMTNLTLFECKPYGCSITINTCNHRVIKEHKEERNSMVKFFTTDRKCVKCEKGKEILKASGLKLTQDVKIKRCNDCGLSEEQGAVFSIRNASADKKSYICMECDRTRQQEYRNNIEVSKAMAFINNTVQEL